MRICCGMSNGELVQDLSGLKTMVSEILAYQESRVSLISSENVTSQLLRAAYSLGLSDQYCSRLPSACPKPGNLSFSNLGILDAINREARCAVLQTFGAAECDVRPLSGLSGLNILLFSLLNPNEVLFRLSDCD